MLCVADGELCMFITQKAKYGKGHKHAIPSPAMLSFWHNL